jgi:aspartokinase
LLGTGLTQLEKVSKTTGALGRLCLAGQTSDAGLTLIVNVGESGSAFLLAEALLELVQRLALVTGRALSIAGAIARSARGFASFAVAITVWVSAPGAICKTRRLIE